MGVLSVRIQKVFGVGNIAVGRYSNWRPVLSTPHSHILQRRKSEYAFFFPYQRVGALCDQVPRSNQILRTSLHT